MKDILDIGGVICEKFMHVITRVAHWQMKNKRAFVYLVDGFIIMTLYQSGHCKEVFNQDNFKHKDKRPTTQQFNYYTLS